MKRLIAVVQIGLSLGILAACAMPLMGQYTPTPSQPKSTKPASVEPPPPAAEPAAPAKPAAKDQKDVAPAEQPAPQLDPVDPTWLDKLKDDDRAAIDDLRGYATPGLGADLAWLPAKQGAPGTAVNLAELRGKVVVIQSFTTANVIGRRWPERVATALKDSKPNDLRILAIHTPENGERAAEFLTRQPPPAGVATAIDTKGATCDALGMYTTPVNLVIDRQGTVRFAGLNEKGLVKAVAQLAQEKFDSKKPMQARPKTPTVSAVKSSAEYPSVTGRVQHAADLRGKPAPDFYADEWITDQANLRDRVVVIDFRATWCGPCRAAIPHMNQLADKFGDQAAFIGLSDEKQDKFEEGQRKWKLKTETFKYSLALDPKATMSQAFKIQAIPHCAIISSDWVVRWQGMPQQLTERTLEQIIKADAAASGKSTEPAQHWRNRWASTK